MAADNCSGSDNQSSGSKLKGRLSISILLIVLLVVDARWAPEAGATKDSHVAQKSGASAAMPLDNIQDVAFTLQRIRQQDVNIYVEATRKKTDRFELNIPSFVSMPDAPLETGITYLPLRKAWLVYFIGTMEPLVQILTEQLAHLDEKAQQDDVPQDKRPEWMKIVKDWKAAINGLNLQLNACGCLVDDTTLDNITVAKAARAIDHQVAVLDEILAEASSFLQKNIPVKS